MKFLKTFQIGTKCRMSVVVNVPIAKCYSRTQKSNISITEWILGLRLVIVDKYSDNIADEKQAFSHDGLKEVYNWYQSLTEDIWLCAFISTKLTLNTEAIISGE